VPYAKARRAAKARKRGAHMHHVITEASKVNRLCVLMIPGFLGEVPSDKV
jgi:hypothetical protein